MSDRDDWDEYGPFPDDGDFLDRIIDGAVAALIYATVAAEWIARKVRR